jgi:hypothetical protein
MKSAMEIVHAAIQKSLETRAVSVLERDDTILAELRKRADGHRTDDDGVIDFWGNDAGSLWRVRCKAPAI